MQSISRRSLGENGGAFAAYALAKDEEGLIHAEGFLAVTLSANVEANCDGW
ncbi:MAG: hypothetical protein ACLPGW_07555 [Roseiarcus sp.]